MRYGYNGRTQRGAGAVHVFDEEGWGERRPLCGSLQMYIPAGPSEGPRCKSCEGLRSQTNHDKEAL
jgi:hypothetical protein